MQKRKKKWAGTRRATPIASLDIGFYIKKHAIISSGKAMLVLVSRENVFALHFNKLANFIQIRYFYVCACIIFEQKLDSLEQSMLT